MCVWPCFPLNNFFRPYMRSKLRNQPSIYGCRFLDLVCSVHVVTIANGAVPGKQVGCSDAFLIQGIFPDLLYAVDRETSCKFMVSFFWT